MGKDLKGKELGKGLSQRQDGYYIGRFTARDGTRNQKVFKKLQECRKWLAEAQFEDEHSDIEQPQDMTIDSWFHFWIDIKSRAIRDSTLELYKSRYDIYIKPAIGDMIITKVKSLHCQKIFNSMADEELKSKTMENVWLVLYAMFEYAVDNDIIVKNPCTSVEWRIGKSSTKREALTIAEQKIILHDVANTVCEYPVKFALQTGLRAGEIIGLKWSDIDFEKRIMKVQRTMRFVSKEKGWVSGPPKTENGIREVPLTDQAIEILKEQKQLNSLLKVVPLEWNDIVFLRKNGLPGTTGVYDRSLYMICERRGMRQVSMHIMRHTFATRCTEAGMKPKTLQMIMGHSNITTTMNLYVHATLEEKENEIKKVSNTLNVKVI